MKKTFVRALLILAIAEVSYLCLVNLALNLPLTQSLINQHRPEKYAVRWDSAWSWYPLRVNARGVSINGQSSSQQWQTEVSKASASLALAPLLRKTVRVHGVQLQDVAFRLRPRPNPEKDYASIREHFPPIQDRDPDSPAVARQPVKKATGWKIQVDGAHATGNHEIWVHQIRAGLEGRLSANATYQSRGGPLSLSGGETDILVQSLTINRDWEASSGGSLKGRFGIAPFVPADFRGIRALRFVTLEADVNAPVNSLRFLDFYLREFSINVDGNGRLHGQLAYEHGVLSPGTHLEVSASKLSLSAPPYEVTGDGGIDIAVAAEDPKMLHVGILFGALEASHQADQTPLFTGKGLAVRARGSSRILPDEARESRQGGLAVTIPSVKVPDLRLYQRYIPTKWDAELRGGRGALQGEVEYGPAQMRAELYLASGDAKLRVKGFRFGTNLDLGLKVRGGAADTASVDVSGTYLSLDGAHLASEEEEASELWQASLAISQGTLGIPVPAGESGESGFRNLSEVFKEKGFKDLLASADAQLKADLAVSDLAWLNLLFRNPFDLAISGSGTIATDLQIREGWISEGTTMRVRPEGLQVNVLDYVAQGEGEVELTVPKGGERPDMQLDAKLIGANLKRQGEDKAVVQDVALEISALASGITVDGGGSVAGIDLRIPSARVKDMTVYNQYLPKKAPLRLLGGEADLTADVRLEPKSAVGFVKLRTKGLRSRLDEQQVKGELTLDIRLKDGVPSDMQFDISGSSLLLDRFKVAGGQKSFDRSDWNGRFDLRKAQVVWKKPIRLDVEASIRMRDSRPIVAMFANQRGKQSWLDDVLTVEDVRGKAELKIAADRVLVPFALVGSDKIDVGAKALIDGKQREGIFYARFRKLHGILKLRDGDRNFDILEARNKFEAYVPGTTPLRLTGGQPETVDTDSDPVPKRPDRTWIRERRKAGKDRSQGSYESFMGE